MLHGSQFSRFCISRINKLFHAKQRYKAQRGRLVIHNVLKGNRYSVKHKIISRMQIDEYRGAHYICFMFFHVIIDVRYALR